MLTLNGFVVFQVHSTITLFPQNTKKWLDLHVTSDIIVLFIGYKQNLINHLGTQATRLLYEVHVYQYTYSSHASDIPAIDREICASSLETILIMY